MGRKTLLYRQPKPLVTRRTDDVKTLKTLKTLKTQPLIKLPIFSLSNKD